MAQLSLIPVSPVEKNEAADHLVEILQAMDDEEVAWDKAKEAHKDTMATLRQAAAVDRATITRAKHEQREGVTARQIEALEAQAKEREWT